MKRILLLGFTLCILSDIMAQSATIQLKDNYPYKEGFRMNDGKMIIMKNGIKKEMEENETLQNGNIVTRNGTVISKAGKTTQVREGDYIDMTGKLFIEPEED